MKTPALCAALLLLFSCASNDGFVEETNTCRPGEPIEIEAGFPDDANPIPDNRLTLLVQISNNSHEDITVKRIRAEPHGMFGESQYELQGGSREFDREIKEGDSAQFEIPMTINIRRHDQQQPLPNRERGAVFNVNVAAELDGGETIRCRFRLPARFF